MVEELRPELQFERLANRDVLEKPEVQARLPIRRHGVVTKIAEVAEILSLGMSQVTRWKATGHTTASWWGC